MRAALLIGCLALLHGGRAAADSSAAATGGWCVVVGTAPYGDFDRAAALAERARRAGAAQAAVYDPRDFENLAWGELVVLGAIDLPDARAAKPLVRALARAKIAAHAKPCKRSDVAAPIKSEDAVRPLPAPGALLVDGGAALRPGCFAWSPRLRSAACVIGRWSVNEPRDGCPDGSSCDRWRVVFLGSELAPIALAERRDDAVIGTGDNSWGANTSTFPLAAAARAELARRLKLGGFVSLAPPRRALARGREVDWMAPRFAVRWRDTAEIRCGGAGAEYAGLGLPLADGDRVTDGKETRESARVSVVPGAGFALIEATDGYGMEGQYASGVSAALVDLASCHVDAGVAE